MVGEVGAAYAGCRARVAEVAGGVDEDRAGASVPTCPQWSVHDVVAHLAGVVDDALAGRLDGVATDPWTAAQVEARRGRPVSEMLAEWDAQAPAFEELLDPIGDLGRQAVADAVSHEHDIRAALHEPGARDSDAVRIGAGFVAPGLVGSAAERGVGLRVCVTGLSTYGNADAAVVLTGDAFDLLRAITGRRSVEQVREMTWAGDPEPVIAAFTWGPFRPALHRIDE